MNVEDNEDVARSYTQTLLSEIVSAEEKECAALYMCLLPPETIASHVEALVSHAEKGSDAWFRSLVFVIVTSAPQELRVDGLERLREIETDVKRKSHLREHLIYLPLPDGRGRPAQPGG
jgi:hypothetical protein